MITLIPEGTADGPEAFGTARLKGADADFPRFQDVFIGRFAQVEVVVVNEVLGGTVDKVGNIPVQVDIFANFRRTDVFIELVQRQTDDLTLDTVRLFRLFAVFIFPRLPGKGDVVDRMDRVRRRRGTVGRGIFDDVRTDGDVKVAAGKDFLQLLDVGRISDVDGDVVRERIHVLFVGDGHIHDFAAHEARLSMLGPGKFIEGQVDIEAQVAYLAGYSFMAQTEGVEGPRIEAGLAALTDGKGAVQEFMLADVAVNVIEDRRIAVEIEVLFAVFIEEDEELLIAVAEEEVLPRFRHDGTVEDEFPQITEGIAAQFLIVMGIGFNHDVKETALALFIGVRCFLELACEIVEVFENDAYGLNHRRSQGDVHREQLPFNGLDEFIEFPRRQLENHLP